ncbi:MAG: Transcriptional regulatory protein terminal [Sediminibacterium sp.]|nr:Transcriptional regulatory protein terminal [Sediminibacterium sp.]
MATYKTQPDAKARYMFWLTFLLLVTIIFVSFGFTRNEAFSLAKQQILLRNIGHEILLHSGDSTSRVLPVKEIAANEYQVRFENEFTFQTDSLVKIIRRSLEKDQLSDDYIVNVVNCSGKEVLFGYAIFENKQNNIIPCSGRKQPRGCYLVNIKFQHSAIIAVPKGYLIGGLSLAFIGLLAVRPFRIRKKRMETGNIENNTFQIGNTLFDPINRQLTILGVTTELTPKENKLLRIFAGSPNDIIERSRLQKEIWEDEGVIVGRSLDVFISKLRKKLENDQSIQIVNVHGKGYKLQISDLTGVDA